MKRAIAASEDNEAEHKLEDYLDETDFPEHENVRGKQLVKLQQEVNALRKLPVKLSQKEKLKLKMQEIR